MTFQLKNKTTNIDADKSIMEIEKLLASAGATAIAKEYMADGRCKSLVFKWQDKGFKIPANIEGVYNTLFKEKRYNSRQNAMRNREEQAYKVTWRIIKDWVHAQLSIIITGQAQMDEVMLPFMFDGKRTLYQAYKTGNLRIEDKGETIVEETQA